MTSPGKPSKAGARALVAFVLAGAFSTLLAHGALAAPYVCFGEKATVVGTSRTDRLRGTNGRDVIVGLGGADEIRGLRGNDLICAGAGGKFGAGDPTERVWGGSGGDRILGGRGSERIYGGPGQDHLFGGSGRDLLFGDSGKDRLNGGPGADLLNGGDGADVLDGGPAPDVLEGDAGDDRIWGGKGPGDIASYWSRYFDNQNGASGSAPHPVRVDLRRSSARGKGHGHDRLSGIEVVWGTEHDDELIGDDKANVLIGAGGDDLLRGMRGSDCLHPGSGANTIDGGKGFDFYSDNFTQCSKNPYHGTIGPWVTDGVTVDLGEGTATRNGDLGGDQLTTLVGVEGVYGSSEEDHLIGDDGPNRLYGMGGNDVLEGDAGDDYLDGGFGVADSADGGAGTDICTRAEATMSCEDGGMTRRF